ncbi:MAG: hypothetical protein M1821_006642 [Bathelium mastoideum]|nr:MAG: hypothetical protein M1821_006642 [Bathelium mastoideum]
MAVQATQNLMRRQTYSGVATFNNYASQSTTVCGPKTGVSGTYGAAAGDISPNISGGLCYASINYDNCNGQTPKSGYSGPACPTTNCGKCYLVTNEGGYGGASVGGVGRSVTVQIIDSCPSVSAFNYCKTDVPADERCGSSSTNALDIDQNAYQALTGQSFGSVSR